MPETSLRREGNNVRGSLVSWCMWLAAVGPSFSLISSVSVFPPWCESRAYYHHHRPNHTSFFKHTPSIPDPWCSQKAGNHTGGTRMQSFVRSRTTHNTDTIWPCWVVPFHARARSPMRDEKRRLLVSEAGSTEQGHGTISIRVGTRWWWRACIAT